MAHECHQAAIQQPEAFVEQQFALALAAAGLQLVGADVRLTQPADFQ